MMTRSAGRDAPPQGTPAAYVSIRTPKRRHMPQTLTVDENWFQNPKPRHASLRRGADATVVVME
jgi:hypothetical protein